jgi:hypothetical protein
MVDTNGCSEVKDEEFYADEQYSALGFSSVVDPCNGISPEQ